MPTVDVMESMDKRWAKLPLPMMFCGENSRSAMHQVVVAYLAAQRQGTHSTKTRGECAAAEGSPGDKNTPEGQGMEAYALLCG